MTYEVFVQDVFPQYYSYMKHALDVDRRGRPVWEVMHDRDAFEDKWFRKKGIGLIKANRDDRTLCKLAFESKEHFLFWLLRWS